MESANGLAKYFGKNLAELLSIKIVLVYKKFDQKAFIKAVAKDIQARSLTQRVEWIADNLKLFLPAHYPEAIAILLKIMGPENDKETGMFTNFHWLMPVGKFVEKYGLDHFAVSMTAIEEITKRNTGEYAIRPFVRKYPEKTLKQMKKWTGSKNFHLRRLASEGLRPKLPWASKLDLFIEKPQPVFAILEILKADPIKFVKKSVANHLTDYIKVNPGAAYELIDKWRRLKNEHTQWIVKHATRKMKK
jgi:3-methyladenine DNA glycosylase AlkC